MTTTGMLLLLPIFGFLFSGKFFNEKLAVNTGEHMYGELWKLCAGPVVDVPQAEERVFYFPQGHMEQVSAASDLRKFESDNI